MTPGARINAAIELLGFIATSPVPMDTTIGDYMRVRRYIGGKDRAAIAQLLYDLVRAQARLCWWLEQTDLSDTPRNRLILWVVLVEKQDTATLFGDSKYSAPALNEQELKAIAPLQGMSLDNPSMPESVRVECPPIFEERLRARFGENFAAQMQALMLPATLDLRVNLAKESREGVKETLHKDRVHMEPTPYSVSGLRSQEKPYVAKTKAFIKGWIEIQDEGSQLIAQLCEAKPGMQVLDYCAGAGGKTLALADAMRGKGRIVAMDAHGRRLEKARPRFKRAGVSDMIELRPLDEERGRKWFKRQKGTFDIVLTDVPCSGTGTWRRNPDLRWRTSAPDFEELLHTQAEILDKACKAVKPGGRLVYATCSLLPDENERQIEAFMLRNKDFHLVEHHLPFVQGAYMCLTPLEHGTDGFFAAVLEKTLPTDFEKINDLPLGKEE